MFFGGIVRKDKKNPLNEFKGLNKKNYLFYVKPITKVTIKNNNESMA